MTAAMGATDATAAVTAGSAVNNGPSSSAASQTRSPSIVPVASPHRTSRATSDLAATQAPRPARSATRAWAAIARASTTMARRNHTWATIWWAATGTVPTRAAVAVAAVRESSRNRVLATNTPPSWRRGIISTTRPGDLGHPSRRALPASSRTNVAAPTHWARTVAQAAPAMPSPAPKMRSGSRIALRPLTARVTMSGVRVSWKPR